MYPLRVPGRLRYRLEEYLLGLDLDRVQLAHLWAYSRRVFPVLCGGPPPMRWCGSILSWLLTQKRVYPRMEPIAFKVWSVPDTIETPRDIVDIVLGDGTPSPIFMSYDLLLTALLHMTLAEIGLEVAPDGDRGGFLTTVHQNRPSEVCVGFCGVRPKISQSPSGVCGGVGEGPTPDVDPIGVLRGIRLGGDGVWVQFVGCVHVLSSYSENALRFQPIQNLRKYVVQGHEVFQESGQVAWGHRMCDDDPYNGLGQIQPEISGFGRDFEGVTETAGEVRAGSCYEAEVTPHCRRYAKTL